MFLIRCGIQKPDFLALSLLLEPSSFKPKFPNLATKKSTVQEIHTLVLIFQRVKKYVEASTSSSVPLTMHRLMAASPCCPKRTALAMA